MRGAQTVVYFRQAIFQTRFLTCRFGQTELDYNIHLRLYTSEKKLL